MYMRAAQFMCEAQFTAQPIHAQRAIHAAAPQFIPISITDELPSA
jgi:hypothetical protein